MKQLCSSFILLLFSIKSTTETISKKQNKDNIDRNNRDNALHSSYCSSLSKTPHRQYRQKQHKHNIERNNRDNIDRNKRTDIESQPHIDIHKKIKNETKSSFDYRYCHLWQAWLKNIVHRHDSQGQFQKRIFIQLSLLSRIREFH